MPHAAIFAMSTRARVAHQCRAPPSPHLAWLLPHMTAARASSPRLCAPLVDSVGLFDKLTGIQRLPGGVGSRSARRGGRWSVVGDLDQYSEAVAVAADDKAVDRTTRDTIHAAVVLVRPAP